jgi:hypothetical protein
MTADYRLTTAESGGVSSLLAVAHFLEINYACNHGDFIQLTSMTP